MADALVRRFTEEKKESWILISASKAPFPHYLLRYLKEELERVNRTNAKGVVMEGFVEYCHLELHLLSQLLLSLKMDLDSAVYVDYSVGHLLSTPNLAKNLKMSLHYVPFETCSKHYEREPLFHVTECDNKTEEEIVNEIITELKGITPGNRETKLTPFELHSGLRLITKHETLYRLRDKVEEVLQLESFKKRVQQPEAMPTIPPVFLELVAHRTTCPLSTPNNLLDYSYFARFSHQLQSYKATFIVEGESVLIVVTNDHMYLVMASWTAAFEVDKGSIPTCCVIASELPKDSLSKQTELEIRFIFEGTVFVPTGGSPLVFISDLLYFKGELGTKLNRDCRQAKIQEIFAKETTSLFVVQPVFELNKIYEWLQKDRRFTFYGLLFVHPGAYCFGPTNRNLFCRNKDSTVDVRIWSGKFDEVSKTWIFEAFAKSNTLPGQPPAEEKICYDVVVTKQDTQDLCIDDGNIVEVRREPVKVPGKGKQRYYWKFVKRKVWAISPMSKRIIDKLTEKERWDVDSIAESCKAMPGGQ